MPPAAPEPPGSERDSGTADGFRGPTWMGPAPPPAPRRLGPADWSRVVTRGLPVAAVLFGGLAVLLLVRAAEAPLAGRRRPVSGAIPPLAFAAACRLIGLRRRVRGRPMTGIGAAVANHASWLDILALGAADRVLFVAKAEVAGWPGIGWLARGAGTLFFRRDRAEAARQTSILAACMQAGQRPLIFPEGTSSDGQRVLRFKPTLFAAFFEQSLKDHAQVQSITVKYTAPPGRDPRLYAWWGAQDFAPHLVQVLAEPRQGRVDVVFHPPRRVADHADRKGLAAACEADVRAGLHAPGDRESPHRS